MKPFVIYSCVQDDKKAALDAKARLDTLKEDKLKKTAAAKVDMGCVLSWVELFIYPEIEMLSCQN
jgi:hypothetical protein